nr:uncharacterized protein [Tanacetum cinerariifolium]
MASSATAAPVILVFFGTHYHIWAVKMKTYLKSQGLWKVVETDESTPALGENPTVAQLRTYDTESLKKDKALTCLHSGCKQLEYVRLDGLTKVTNVGYARVPNACLNLKFFEIQHDLFLKDFAFKDLSKVCRSSFREN